MNKRFKARIIESRKNLWSQDENHLPIFDGLGESDLEWRFQGVVITKEQAETATRGVLPFIRPYYDTDYFQTRKKKWCIYINKHLGSQQRERIANKYFGGKLRWGHYDYMGYHPAEKEYLIFPHFVSAEMGTVPMGFARRDAVIGKGLYALADPTPWEIGILSSALYAEWAKTVGKLQFYDGANYFPFPPRKEGDSETMEPYIAPLLEHWKTGLDENLPEALKTLNGYVDSLYRERCSGELDNKLDPADRLRYILALSDRRGALAKAAKERENYDAHNILAHPDVPRISQPTLLAVLNSKEPVQPSGLEKNVLSQAWEPYGPFLTLTKKGYLRRVETDRTLVDKNGRKLNTVYEAAVDYMEFFAEWIRFYLPEGQERRRKVWELAQLPETGERNPLFPTINEYKSLKILWRADRPVTKKEVKAEGGTPVTLDKLLEKELVEEMENEPKQYRAVLSEVDFDVIAIREILSKMDERSTEVLSVLNKQLF